MLNFLSGSFIYKVGGGRRCATQHMESRIEIIEKDLQWFYMGASSA